VFLQENFAIVVEDDEVVPENLESVKTIVAYIEGKIGHEA
jgi:acyl carrier protein